ncbi:FAD-dependent oxidoreductase [Acuticoccus kandeliae]|uniref:FAD-dependent oxidoreductase n=1 Tax=Acuticoccus kandeliae TaxID=2073160 RepID=UPI000D3E6A1A|nr:FAD-dependent oxidoreductase [Acuticoccus kandeliae]
MTDDDAVDVIVVGGGLAGHAAMLAAAEAGASVLMIEKEGAVGGSTLLSGGFMAFAGTREQAAAGIADDEALLLDDLRTVAGPDADDALLTTYASRQRALYDWLVERGVVFSAVELSAGQSAPRSHRTDTDALLACLADTAAATGRIRRLLDTPARRLLTDTEGRVEGILVSTQNGERAITARRGVILTTGGFSRSETLLRTYAPNQAAALRIGGAGNTGDGLRMAMKCGADLRDMGQIRGTFGTHPTTGPDAHKVVLAFYLGAIIVNRDGARFVAESASYKQLGDACLQQPGALGFQIWDAGIAARSQPGVPLFDLDIPEREGLLLKADSLAGLAALCGVPAETLEESVRAYNYGIAGGADPLGRDGLCHGTGECLPLTEPPFYAYPSTSVVLATYCGVRIDESARVIDVFGDPIPGLYAAGEMTGGFHGQSYMTGTSLGKAALFGRIAGERAAVSNDQRQDAMTKERKTHGG